MGDAFGAGIINHLSRNDILEFNNQINNSSNPDIVDPSMISSNNNSRISLIRFGQSNTSKKNISNISLQRVGQSNSSITRGNVTNN